MIDYLISKLPVRVIIDEPKNGEVGPLEQTRILFDQSARHVTGDDNEAGRVHEAKGRQTAGVLARPAHVPQLNVGRVVPGKVQYSQIGQRIVQLEELVSRLCTRLCLYWIIALIKLINQLAD